jgi:hypothetical protein
MAHSIVVAIERIKREVAKWLTPEAIEQTARELGHQWRDCLLDPVRTIHLFLLQILHGNTACEHVPRLGNVRCTGAAYCEARSRLPLALLQRLLWRLSQPLRDIAGEEGRWRGHRTFHVDGSAVSMPDTPELQARFGQPRNQAPGCGFPVMRLLALFHAGTGFLMQLVDAPLRTNDLAMASRVHPQLQEGDILIGDRGFYGFAHLALLVSKKLHVLFRLPPQIIVSFRPHRRASRYRIRKAGESGIPTSKWIKRLGWHDQIVDYVKVQFVPPWMAVRDFEALPNVVRVRELRYRVRQRGFRSKEVTLVTTLLDPNRYPAEAIAELYRQRWQIEINLRHMKQTMRMDVLHCKSVTRHVCSGLQLDPPSDGQGISRTASAVGAHQLHRCGALAGAGSHHPSADPSVRQSGSTEPHRAARNQTSPRAIQFDDQAQVSAASTLVEARRCCLI